MVAVITYEIAAKQKDEWWEGKKSTPLVLEGVEMPLKAISHRIKGKGEKPGLVKVEVTYW